MKIKITKKEFRKTFDENFKNFILRVREKSNEDGIVYYNGIKALKVEEVPKNEEVPENEKIIKLSFPINAYKINAAVVKDNYFNKDTYIKELAGICDRMKDYFEFSISEINFKRAESYDLNKIKKNLEKFSEYISKYIKNFDYSEVYKRIVENEEIKLEFKEITNISEILELQFNTFKTLITEVKDKETNEKDKNVIIIRNTFRGINFNFKATPDNTKDNTEYEINDNHVEKFKNTIIKAIDSYKGKEALEKKYQHLFMLNAANAIGLFNKNGEIYPFEQEYEIRNYNRKDPDTNRPKKGRVDCIFFQINKDKLTDLYLIELKVNEDVILGSNGVLTHLDDVQSLIGNGDEIKNKKDFLDIKNLIEYRLQHYIKDKKFKLSNKEKEIDFKIHFYTVIGFQGDEEHKSKVIGDLKLLTDEQEIKKLVEKRNLPEWSKTIYEICKPIKDKYIIKFFFDNEFINFSSVDKFSKNIKCEEISNMVFENNKGYFDE